MRDAGYGLRGAGLWAKGRAHRAWRIEKGDLEPQFLSFEICFVSSVFCHMSSVFCHMVACYVLREACCEMRGAGCGVRVVGLRDVGLWA